MNHLRQISNVPARRPVLVAKNSEQLLVMQVQHIRADARLQSILERAMLAGGPTLAKSLSAQLASLYQLSLATKHNATKKP